MNFTPLNKIRHNRFWVYQLLGWWALVVALIFLSLLFNPPTDNFWFALSFVYFANSVIGVILTCGLRYIYRFVWDKGFILRFILAWMGSLIAAYFLWLSQIFLRTLLLDRQTIMERVLFGDFSFCVTLILLWSGAYFIFKYNLLFQIEKEKSLRSEALAHEAQLLMLRYQLNPHFLFNALNAISTLVLTKAVDPANEMVTKLSKFLRYSLDHSPFGRVSLAHEIETSQLYLDIEKVRFSERLKLVFDIEDTVRDSLVPTMVLQPLIENSIKHGISKNEKGGTLQIKAREVQGSLVLEVIDDGPGISGIDGRNSDKFVPTGVGISNIRNRLRELYGETYELRFTNVTPNGLSAQVRIPNEYS